MSLEYDKLEKVVLLFWDEKDNYEKEETKLKIGTSLYKDICNIHDADSFKDALNKHNEPSQHFLCLVHLSHSKDNKGFYSFKNSKILKEFPGLNYYLITSSRLGDVYGKVDNLEGSYVYTYDSYQEKIFNTFHPQTKYEMLHLYHKDFEMNINLPQCDYAIITALEEDEMEKVLPMITKDKRVANEKHLIEYGHITAKPEKKIAYASQQATGMVDAAILATELITLFRPKYLIMAGVLGGKPKDVKLGDVVIATKVFTIDKGKISDFGFKMELETANTEGSHITALRRARKEITQYLRKEDNTRDSQIDLHFGSIACLRQVINLEGYFEEEVSAVDRKALALEMESYGVSRACELVNDGKTKALIIKSAMDNTEGKTDKEKPYAAWSSAKFIQYILENDVI